MLYYLVSIDVPEKLILTFISAVYSKFSPIQWPAVIGGWCETCSEINLYPFYSLINSKVSPSKGLNGFLTLPIHKLWYVRANAKQYANLKQESSNWFA